MFPGRSRTWSRFPGRIRRSSFRWTRVAADVSSCRGRVRSVAGRTPAFGHSCPDHAGGRRVTQRAVAPAKEPPVGGLTRRTTAWLFSNDVMSQSDSTASMNAGVFRVVLPLPAPVEEPRQRPALRRVLPPRSAAAVVLEDVGIISRVATGRIPTALSPPVFAASGEPPPVETPTACIRAMHRLRLRFFDCHRRSSPHAAHDCWSR